MIDNALVNYRDCKALSHKVNGKWVSWTYKEFYRDIKHYANAFIAMDIKPLDAINIIGFNHPAWFLTFYGALYANVIPVGVYTTNGPDACKYVAEHSRASAVIVENTEHLKKYLKIWDQIPQLKTIIVYNDKIPTDIIPENRRKQVITLADLLEMGRQFGKQNDEKYINERLKDQKPGNVCTLVYTSGTTGPPKGVMLSHDNYTFLVQSYVYEGYQQTLLSIPVTERRAVSYLPLSHVAA